jgi:hypothetical protein
VQLALTRQESSAQEGTFCILFMPEFSVSGQNTIASFLDFAFACH